MNDRQLMELRRRLVEERAQVVKHMRAHSGESETSGTDRDIGDMVDDVNRRVETFTQDSLAGSEARLLEKIDLALQRIERGTYGRCMACDDHIPDDRLIAKPSVSLCIGCQEEKERKSRG